MHRIWLAIRAFFVILFQADAARRIEAAMSASTTTDGAVAVSPAAPSRAAPTAKPQVAAPAAPAPAKPQRSEALTLLAALQREARFVDFLKEPLAAFSDAEVGAVVRAVHRDCAAVVERMFALQPAAAESEGAELDVPAGFDPQRFRLVGNVSGEPPFRGRLLHAGWRATRCEVPRWSGSGEAALVVAPIEVEMK